MEGYIQNGQNGFVANAYVSSDKFGPYIIGVFDTEAEARAAVEAKIKEWFENVTE